MSVRRTFSVAIFFRRDAVKTRPSANKRLATWLPVRCNPQLGESPLLEAARRELREETGLEGVFPLGPRRRRNAARVHRLRGARGGRQGPAHELRRRRRRRAARAVGVRRVHRRALVRPRARRCGCAALATRRPSLTLCRSRRSAADALWRVLLVPVLARVWKFPHQPPPFTSHLSPLTSHLLTAHCSLLTLRLTSRRFNMIPLFQWLQHRAAGVLLHPTSLPGSTGIGTFGREARHFVDFIAESGMKYWQVCPLGPTGFGDSPYQCYKRLPETLISSIWRHWSPRICWKNAIWKSCGGFRLIESLRGAMDSAMAGPQKGIPRIRCQGFSERKKRVCGV